MSSRVAAAIDAAKAAEAQKLAGMFRENIKKFGAAVGQGRVAHAGRGMRIRLGTD